MGKTSIEWTEHSWPVINGCRRISEGCRNCYAERLTATRLSRTPKYEGLAVFGQNGPRWTGKVRLWEKHLDMPIRLRKPSKIFVCDMGDLFYEEVADEAIAAVFGVMLLAQHHTFQVLTKRPDRMRAFMRTATVDECIGTACRFGVGFPPGYSKHVSKEMRAQGRDPKSDEWASWPPRHVWLGVSVENQATADDRISVLLETPAAIRWISAEPLLASVGLFAFLKTPLRDLSLRALRSPDMPGLDWVVVGGESGPDARPMRAEWVRTIRDQCAAAGVAFFFKQWGEHVEVAGYRAGDDGRVMFDAKRRPLVDVDGHQFVRMGKKEAGRQIDGNTYSEFPR